MKNSFLDYYKMILEKVSFDEDLFAREYQKAATILRADEKKCLDKWIRSRFNLSSRKIGAGMA